MVRSGCPVVSAWGGALQDVVRGRETEPEVVEQMRVFRHRLEFLFAGLEEPAGASRRPGSLLLQLFERDDRAGLSVRLPSPRGDLLVQLVFHVVLERLRLVLVRHDGESTCGKACQEGFTIDFHHLNLQPG